jgi:hypothetical protein
MSFVVLLSLLAGMVLGQRFKVLILAPAILLALPPVVAFGYARGDAGFTVALACLAAIGCLQIGYVFGIGIRHLLLVARASRLRAVGFAKPLPVRRPAH